MLQVIGYRASRLWQQREQDRNLSFLAANPDGLPIPIDVFQPQVHDLGSTQAVEAHDQENRVVPAPGRCACVYGA
jgi:hypothetical protein